MDKLLLKNLFILSAFCGMILAIVALVPHLGILSTTFVLCFVCLPAIILLQKTGKLELFTVKDSLITGALSGFAAYMAFCVIFIPIVYLLSLFTQMEYLGGLVLIIKMSSFGLILLFVFFVSIIAVIFNSFTSLIYYYVSDSIKGIDTEKTFKLK